MMGGMRLLAYIHQQRRLPAGGSLEFARAVERRYLEQAASSTTRRRSVEQILVERDTAVGVRLYDDTEHRADVVISAADGRGTIYHMLDGRYSNGKLDGLYNGHPPLQTHDADLLRRAAICAIRRTGSPTCSTRSKLSPARSAMNSVYSTMAAIRRWRRPGHTGATVLLRSDYDYWQRIWAQAPYDTEQLQVAEQVLAIIEQHHPGIRDDVEVTDGHARELRALHRQLAGLHLWLAADAGDHAPHDPGMPKTLPGLRNLYLAGQWVEPGGSVTLSAASGQCRPDDLCGGWEGICGGVAGVRNGQWATVNCQWSMKRLPASVQTSIADG